MGRTAKLTRLVTVTAAALALGLPAARADEGIDLMKQITSQWVRPNILLVVDRSGSMRFDLYSTVVGVDSVGTWPTATWSDQTSYSLASGCTPKYDAYGHVTGYVAPCKIWKKRLRVSQTYPSRMATLKNALGNSIAIVTQWFPPGYTDASPGGTWPAISANSWSIAGGASSATGPVYSLTDVGPPTLQDWTWTVTFSNAKNDPGIPFQTDPAPLINTNSATCGATGATDRPQFGYGVGTDTGTDATKISSKICPADLVGKTKDTVNWGLMQYSGNTCPSTDFTATVTIDCNDTGVVTGMENALKLQSAGGMDALNGTPTKKALSSAQNYLTTLFNGDPKKTCGRTYGAILFTDGLSNMCNPNSGDWISPCGSAPYECDSSGSSGIDCDKRGGASRQYTRFPAGDAENMYFANLGANKQKVRTWVVGVSNDVGPCELNFTAYMGRTDASAPNGDAGFVISKDQYLSSTQGDESKYTINSTHPAYAFFATTSGALQDVMADILAALGAGDYTTSAPSLTQSPADLTSVGLITSASYPDWQGHLYGYDVLHPTNLPDPYYYPLLWDAGQTLSTGTFDVTGDGVPDPNHNFARVIYTWNQKGTVKPVKIDSSSSSMATQLETLCAIGKSQPCGITPAVVDFIRGYDGTLTNTRRKWALGALINTTPAVIGPPEVWKQGTLQSHTNFEQAYSNRHKLVWAGSSDGMVHAFDTVDGAEILALLPPDLLDTQVTLYNNYLNGKTRPDQINEVGEKKDPNQHIYGVANSIRFADVWDSKLGNYRTMLFITEGPGGTGIHGVDVTAPYPGRTAVPYKVWKHAVPTGDNDYTVGTQDFPADCTSCAPFDPLWSYTADGSANTTQLADLGQTWAVPALGAIDAVTWRVTMGAGWDPNRIGSTQGPAVVRFEPVSGNVISKFTNLTRETSGTYVTNQTYADNNFIQTNSQFFQPDNMVDQGVQLDLHGHVWLLNKGASPAWNPVALTDSSSLIKGQPLYFPAAVAPYPADSPKYDVYAFSSGTFYEKSTTVTGPLIGTTGYFSPAIYVAARKLSDGSVSISRTYLKNLPVSVSANLGPRTQVTQYPLLLIPKPGSTGQAIATYLVYDPGAGACIGSSYVVIAKFDPANVAGVTTANYTVAYAGEGASSGYTVDLTTGDILVAKSNPSANAQGDNPGQTQRAYFPSPGNTNLPKLPHYGGMGGTIAWWAELQ